MALPDGIIRPSRIGGGKLNLRIEKSSRRQENILATHGKPAGNPCVQLADDFHGALFGRPERPAFCVSLRPTPEMCGADRDGALDYLAKLESATGGI